MAAGFNTSPFVLPNMFPSPGESLQQGLYNQERRADRQSQIDYRNQKDKEADDWRKLNLIQELSNVDRYQTGESVADAIGNMKSQEILQKYTAAAGSMSPAELQAKISQDIQNTAAGMQSMKDELSMSTKTLADLKTRFPSLDTKALDRYYREDVLNRRIENGEFKNPIHINPTNMRFDDPDFLAAFVSGDKAIRDEIVNPKLVEKGVQLGMGSPSSYTSVGGDIPFFRERNFNPDTDVQGGYLKKGIDPHMKLRSSVEKINGKDIEVLNKGAFDVFSDNAKLEFNAIAAKRFPEFYSLPKEERNKLTRQIALEEIKELDQSDFSFKSATKPPSFRSSTNIYGGSGTNINDIYSRMRDRVKELRSNNISYADGREMQSDEIDVALDAVKKKGFTGLTQDDIKIGLDDNDNIQVLYSDKYISENDNIKPLITTIGRVAANFKGQPGVNEKRQVVQQGNNKSTGKTETYTRAELKGAGWTDAQINEAVKLGKIKVQ